MDNKINKTEEINVKEDFHFINYQLINKELETYLEHKYFSDIIKNTREISDNSKYTVLMIIKILDSKNINIDQLKKLVYEGLDEIPSLRSIVWKVLLNYLPRNIDLWEEILTKHRNNYNELKQKHLKNNKFLFKKNNEQMKIFKDDDKRKNSCVYKKNSDSDSLKVEKKSISDKIENNTLKNISNNEDSEKYNTYDNEIINNNKFTNSPIKKDIKKTKNNINIKKVSAKDHPLESSNTSKWKNMLSDVDLHEEILKDTKRTRNEINFFNQQIQNDSNLTAREILTNCLFIFSKEMKYMKYSQGMNEVIALLLYCFSFENNPYFKKYIEADTFWCFKELMKGLEIWYINVETNIPLKLKEFENLLIKRVKEIHNLFSKFKIDFGFFVFRWVSLCFCQEYDLPELMRLWDAALSSNKTMIDFFMLYSISILKLNHETFIKSEFSEIMKFVQEDVSTFPMEKILKYLLILDS